MVSRAADREWHAAQGADRTSHVGVETVTPAVCDQGAALLRAEDKVIMEAEVGGWHRALRRPFRARSFARRAPGAALRWPPATLCRPSGAGSSMRRYPGVTKRPSPNPVRPLKHPGGAPEGSRGPAQRRPRTRGQRIGAPWKGAGAHAATRPYPLNRSGFNPCKSSGTKRPSRRITSPSKVISPPPYSGRWISTMSQWTSERLPLSATS
jgi:hypothetical protein